MYSKTTHSVCISVSPHYLQDQSDPQDHHYVWAYTIFIENKSSQAIQLIGRRWEVTDALGQLQYVEGEGVVGEQPIIRAGEGFQYTSGTVLVTPSGVMLGAYEMENMKTHARFWVDIPAFSLDSPHEVVRLN